MGRTGPKLKLYAKKNALAVSYGGPVFAVTCVISFSLERGNNMGKWWSLIAAIGASVVTAVTPTVQSALSHHPLVTTVIGSIIAVVLHWLPSPVATK